MSTTTSSSEDDFDPIPMKEHRVAKKSTATSSSASSYSSYSTRSQLRAKAPRVQTDRFLENFNPETSIREKRKLIRKINPPSNVRRPQGAVYDENGIHINTGIDLCDCLNEDCMGCFFECPKCDSQKCGTDCRVHRKYVIEQIEYHGFDNVIKNPLLKY